MAACRDRSEHTCRRNSRRTRESRPELPQHRVLELECLRVEVPPVRRVYVSELPSSSILQAQQDTSAGWIDRSAIRYGLVAKIPVHTACHEHDCPQDHEQPNGPEKQ